MAAVKRLNRTWRSFTKKTPKLAESYEEIVNLVSPKGQYANYRKSLKNLQAPVLPFLGLYFILAMFRLHAGSANTTMHRRVSY